MARHLKQMATKGNKLKRCQECQELLMKPRAIKYCGVKCKNAHLYREKKKLKDEITAIVKEVTDIKREDRMTFEELSDMIGISVTEIVIMHNHGR